jgi:hypothetical protein
MLSVETIHSETKTQQTLPYSSNALTFTFYGFLTYVPTSNHFISLIKVFSQSIMPISLLVPSLLRIQPPPDLKEDQPHPLHTFIEPLLLSLRAAANKYHNELPQILADGGGAGEAEEIMMWYALGYEKTDASAENSEHLNKEDTVMLEDKWRSAWLERMEQRE